ARAARRARRPRRPDRSEALLDDGQEPVEPDLALVEARGHLDVGDLQRQAARAEVEPETQPHPRRRALDERGAVDMQAQAADAEPQLEAARLAGDRGVGARLAPRARGRCVVGVERRECRDRLPPLERQIVDQVETERPERILRSLGLLGGARRRGRAEHHERHDARLEPWSHPPRVPPAKRGGPSRRAGLPPTWLSRLMMKSSLSFVTLMTLLAGGACGGSGGDALLSSTLMGQFQGQSFTPTSGVATVYQGSNLIAVGDGPLTCSSTQQNDPPMGTTATFSVP